MILRRSGFTWWLIVFCLLGAGLQISANLSDGPVYVPNERDVWMQARMQDAVDRALRVIGHGVVVDSVIAQPRGDGFLASYYRSTNQVWVDSEAVFSQAEFELVAAHECVHALFNHSLIDDLYATRDWAHCQLIEEMTAYVLGAHIAGRMRARQGGDGPALTERLISEYRQDCDWSSEESPRRKLWEKVATEGEKAIDPWEASSIEIHYGSTELVDAIDEICREHPDPWDAAQVIAKRYIEPIPEPVVSGQTPPEDG